MINGIKGALQQHVPARSGSLHISPGSSPRGSASMQVDAYWKDNGTGKTRTGHVKGEKGKGKGKTGRGSGKGRGQAEKEFLLTPRSTAFGAEASDIESRSVRLPQRRPHLARASWRRRFTARMGTFRHGAGHGMTLRGEIMSVSGARTIGRSLRGKHVRGRCMADDFPDTDHAGPGDRFHRAESTVDIERDFFGGDPSSQGTSVVGHLSSRSTCRSRFPAIST